MNMKKIMTVAMAMGLAVAAQATPYWASVNTDAYSKDTEPATEKSVNYTAYYCTKAAVQAMFGQYAPPTLTASTIAEALNAKDSDGYWTWVNSANRGTAIDQSSYFAAGQYTFTSYLSGASASDTYFAIVSYASGSDYAFQVFGNDSTLMASGQLLFDNDTTASDGGASGWKTAAVPEPTSALLMLFGLAGLALKRRA